jgi:tetratricopeptide (TPR) repeat protein
MKEVREEIRQESGNVGAAVLWQAVHGEEEGIRETLRSLNAFYWVQGWHEGVDAFKRLVETLEDQAESETRPGGAKEGRLASALAYLAFWTSATGDAAESGRIVERCLPALRRLGFYREVAACLCVLGVNASNEGDYSESVKYLEEGAAIEAGAQDFSQWFDIWLGWDYFELGNYAQAEMHYRTACDRARARGDKLGLAFALTKWAMVADALKDYPRGMRMHQDALDVFVDLENKGGQAYCLTRLSFTAWGLGRYEEAARLGHAGYEAFESLGHPWGMIRSLCVIGFADLALGQLEQARASFADALGRAMQHHQVSNALYALIGLAGVTAREGDSARAAEILAFAIQHRFTPALFRDIARSEFVDLGQRLSPDVLAAARTKGEASTLEQVVAALGPGQVSSPRTDGGGCSAQSSSSNR